MRKRVHIALGVVLVMLAGVIAWQVLREREPVYQGKRLSSWLKAHGGQGWQRNADEAVRQAGTNAIPTLLRMLCAKDSPLKAKFMDLAERQHIIKVQYTSAIFWNRAAEHGFEVLGAKAQSAVPALIEIADQKIPSTSQINAITALGLIGPSSKEAVPSLLRWATNADVYVRSSAIHALGAIHAEPDRVVPVLINGLHDSDSRVQVRAVMALEKFGPNVKIAAPTLVEAIPSLLWWATNASTFRRLDAVAVLGSIGAEPDRVVPALTNALHDPYASVRFKAVEALRHFGPDAKPAVPALVEYINSHDNSPDRWAATKALKAIDPEAAAKAGVK